MTITPAAHSSSRPSLRVWPGVALLILQWLLRFVLPIVEPEALLVGLFGGVAAAGAILVWWVFFSRAPWPDRVGAIGLMVAGLFVTSRLVDASIQNGLMGRMLFVHSIPILSLALVGAVAATRHRPDGVRRAAVAIAILLACGGWTLLRTNGIRGGGPDMAWRWTKTPEQLLLARGRDDVHPPSVASTPAPVEPVVAPAPAGVDAPLAAAPVVPPVATAPAATAAPLATAPAASWPGFRGPARDGTVRGVQINTEWATSPPVQLWRRPIGPGWSSFAVRGDLLYTQEQRGDDEVVACYKVSTGEPVWRHRDPVRFWESNGGAGPRATPTLEGNRVYAFGATGILNALDAANGAVAWSRNAASDTGRKVPDWGFASSPLVVDDVVIVAVSGTLIGYDIATGRPRWTGPQHGGSYSSPQRATFDGVPQVVLLTGAGATSVAPADGTVLWEHGWSGSAIVQPAFTAEGDILVNTIASTGGVGTRRLAVSRSAGGWTAAERWTSTGLKPYFNDFVVHKGHAYGFDGSILACIDLADGKRVWKGGRYGNGQLVLLPDEDLLLVLSEEGELALVRAAPDQFTEAARFRVLDGKTWNHPVLVGDVLLVRNGEEMAAFRLSLTNR